MVSPGPVLWRHRAGEPMGVVFLLTRKSALHVCRTIPEEINSLSLGVYCMCVHVCVLLELPHLLYAELR